MVDGGAYFPPGKLPSDILGRLLRDYVTPDPRVLIGPGIGADAAAVDLGDRVLVVKSDPITFPTPDAGGYLVNVNANDIACMGAEPRWLLVTALLPERTTDIGLVETIFAGVVAAARPLGIHLIGGHTEITLGLDRPILVGQLLGETTRDQLLDLRTAQPDDALILANGIAIEGTAILAQEAEPALLAGIEPALLERARGFASTPGISVVHAARALRSSGATLRGMHDPTEGGLASALREIAVIAGAGILINGDAIPIYPETQAICAALNLDPLGLVASGALLAVVAASDVAQALASLKSAGVDGAHIGTLTSRAGECLISHGTVTSPLASFDTDELARYLASAT